MASPDTEDPPGERPRWSITWLLRIQRVGRNRPLSGGSEMDPTTRRGFGRFFPWAVLAALLVEIGLLVWLGIIPR